MHLPVEAAHALMLPYALERMQLVVVYVTFHLHAPTDCV
jgi:hypothetical protein